MKRTLATLMLATTFAGGAFAQTAPVGGADAKGNSPVKAVHTINDGSAKPAANSFTQGQAMKHIENSGYTGVSGLTKGSDGVWRGTAMKNGAPVDVAMDFKGNVTEAMPPVVARRMRGPASPMTPAEDNPGMAPGSSMNEAMHHHRHHHHHHHRGGGHGMSGVDRNKNGISDKEDRSMAPR